MKSIILVTLFLMSAICYGQIDSAAVSQAWYKKHSQGVWIDGRTMIISKSFPFVIDLKRPNGIFIDKGTQYITLLVHIPDSSKARTVNLSYSDYVTPIPVIKETIIDGVTTNPANQYSGAWVHSTASWTSVFGGTASYSITPGSTLTISFTGNRIQWFSEKSNNKGTAAVSIDGGPEVTVNLFATNATPPNVKSIVFDSSITEAYNNLTQGTHKFVIRVISPSVLHDEVKVFSK